jgi:hypothetical protein
MTIRRLRGGWRAVALACATLAGGTVEAAGAVPVREVRPPGLAGPLGNEWLSDHERVTRHARAIAPSAVRLEPLATSPGIARLRYFTEDGPDEIYLVTRSRLDADGDTWLQIRVPMRPRPRTGWVPREKLGHLVTVRTKLRVSRRTQRAILYEDDRRVWSSPVGVGAPRTPTPAGRFWVRTRLRGFAGRRMYGPWAFGTSAYSVLTDWPGGGVVGIHGTDEPELIPGRVSHGCIRVPNGRIRQLARLMPIGTPIEIV